MRVPRIDNAKFVLIALVVSGHLLEPTRAGSPLLESAYRWIYLFHIPAFAYLSGVLSPAEFGVKQGRRWLAGIVLPLIVFQGLYLAADAALFDKPFRFSVTTPYWLLWYLASLACWRVLLPAMMSLRYPVAVAVLLALAVGYAHGISYQFSLSRTLVFLPFFVAGHIHGLPQNKRPAIALATLAVLAVLAWNTRWLSPTWLYGSTPYHSAWGSAIRAAVLAAGAIGTWAVLALIPSRASVLSWLGQHSLSAYLLHGFVVKACIAFALFRAAHAWSPSIRLVAAFAVGMTLTAALAALGRYIKPVMDYGWAWRDRSSTRSTDRC